MSFGTLCFGFGDVVGEPRPFAEGEVDQVVDLSMIFCYEVDAP